MLQLPVSVRKLHANQQHAQAPHPMMSKLPILSTILGAYGAVFRNFGTLIRAFTLPFLVLLVLSTMRDAMSPGFVKDLLFWAASLPFLTLAAMACQRVVLLGPDSLNNPWSLYWTERETSFFINLIILSGLSLLAGWVFGVIFLMSPERPFGFHTPWLGLVLTYVAVTYLLGRFGMILPANSLGKNMFLSNSWYLTAGNGPHVAIVLLVPMAILVAVVMLIGPYLTSRLGFVGVLIIFALHVVTLAVEFAALASSYRFLSDSAKSSN